MKLAEALILRADYKTRIEQLRQRLIRNAKVQEGDSPAEDPQEMLAEVERITDELRDLIQKINRTNMATVFEAGVTLSDGLAVRDALGIRQEIYRTLAAASTITQDRYSRSEVKFKSTVEVAAIQKQADQYAREYRELDARIQALNWTTELLES
jgi:hypothetical protein